MKITETDGVQAGICDVCGGIEELTLCYDILEVVNSEGIVIHSELQGVAHCLCQKHMGERKTIRKEYITVAQLGELLVLLGKAEEKMSYQKRMWLKQLLKNCLQGLDQSDA